MIGKKGQDFHPDPFLFYTIGTPRAALNAQLFPDTRRILVLHGLRLVSNCLLTLAEFSNSPYCSHSSTNIGPRTSETQQSSLTAQPPADLLLAGHHSGLRLQSGTLRFPPDCPESRAYPTPPVRHGFQGAE